MLAELITLGVDGMTLATGSAFGINQLLLSAGARGKRGAVPHARISMRQPNADSALDIPDQRQLSEMASLIAKHTGQTIHRVLAGWYAERYFTAEEALAYGIIDHIVPDSR